MRNTNKKGFTIVELVVVVAVIAILAAVLIPTFSGIIKKAQLSADQKAVQSMNTYIAMEGKEMDYNQMFKLLSSKGYNNKSLVPVSNGYAFYYIDNIDTVVLVDADNKVVFPEIKDITGKTVPAGNYNLVLGITNAVVSTPEDFADSAVNAGDVIVSGDIKNEDTIAIKANVELDNGAKLEAPQVEIIENAPIIKGNGTIKTNFVIKNGGLNIGLSGSEMDVKFEAADPTQALIKNEGGWNISIFDGEFTADIIFEIAEGKTVTINGGTFNGKAFNEMTEADWLAVCAGDYYVDISGSTVVIMAF